MQTYELTQEQLEKIIRIGFLSGEQWGKTHQGWFTPTDEQTEEKIQKCIEEIEKATE